MNKYEVQFVKESNTYLVVELFPDGSAYQIMGEHETEQEALRNKRMLDMAEDLRIRKNLG